MSETMSQSGQLQVTTFTDRCCHLRKANQTKRILVYAQNGFKLHYQQGNLALNTLKCIKVTKRNEIVEHDSSNTQTQETEDNFYAVIGCDNNHEVCFSSEKLLSVSAHILTLCYRNFME